MTFDSGAKLIVGCGYLGMPVALHWLGGGCPVYAVTRFPRRAEEFEQLGLRPIVADVTQPQSLSRLPNVETVFCAVGFDASAGKSQQEVYAGGLRNLLAALPTSWRRMIYTSTIGVYGQNDGSWVDESSPTNPATDGGVAHLAAEALLAGDGTRKRATILRMAGLYGPGRLPRQDDLIAGRPLATNPRSHLNLIHIDDAVRAVAGAGEANRPCGCYLVSDGHPVLRRDFFAELARLIGAPAPTFGPDRSAGPDSSRFAGRGVTDKRVRNTKMVEILGVRPEISSFREGLAASI